MKCFVPVVLFIAGCASTRTAQGPYHTSLMGQEPVPTSINLSSYAPPPQPDLTSPIRIRTVVINQVPGAMQAIVRRDARYVIPDDGLYINTVAEAAIEATVNEQLRTCQNDNRRNIAETRAQALHDLQIMQNDMNILRSFYQAQVRNREITIDAANSSIVALQRASTSNFWQSFGWIGVGFLTGVTISAGIAGVYLLTH